MKHVKLFESFINEALDTNTAMQGYNALLKLIDLYDGYATSIGVAKDDKYWGDMEALNDEINNLLGSQTDNIPNKIKTASDVVNNWKTLESIAKKIVDGAEGMISEGGQDSIGRYVKAGPAKIKTVKKLFNIK